MVFSKGKVKIKVKIDKDKVESIKHAIELKTPDEIAKATEYSVRGFRAVLFGEKAFRTDIVVFGVCSIIATLLRIYELITWCELAVMEYVVFMALVGEIINTAIETTVDRISKEYHPLSGRAKDIGSAIVFVSFFGAGLAWAIILIGIALNIYKTHIIGL